MGSSAIETLVEHTTRFAMLVHLPPHARTRSAQNQQRSHARWVRHGTSPKRYRCCRSQRYPNSSRRSLTWDQSTEMAQYAHFRVNASPDRLLVRPPKSPTGAAPTTAPPIHLQRHQPPPDTPGTTSTLPPQHSTPGPARPSAWEPPPKPSTSTYTLPHKAVLQQPPEPGLAAGIGVTNQPLPGVDRIRSADPECLLGGSRVRSVRSEPLSRHRSRTPHTRTGPGGNIRYAGCPQPVRTVRLEAPVDQIDRPDSGVIWDDGLPLFTPDHAFQAFLGHEPFHSAPRHPNSFPLQLAPHFAGSAHPEVRFPHPPDQELQLGVTPTSDRPPLGFAHSAFVPAID